MPPAALASAPLRVPGTPSFSHPPLPANWNPNPPCLRQPWRRRPYGSVYILLTLTLPLYTFLPYPALSYPSLLLNLNPYLYPSFPFLTYPYTYKPAYLISPPFLYNYLRPIYLTAYSKLYPFLLSVFLTSSFLSTSFYSPLYFINLRCTTLANF